MSTTTINEAEANLMRKLNTGFWMLKGGKATPAIQSLIERGFARTCKVRSGPLGIYTGEVGILLTDAGKMALEATK